MVMGWGCRLITRHWTVGSANAGPLHLARTTGADGELEVGPCSVGGHCLPLDRESHTSIKIIRASSPVAQMEKWRHSHPSVRLELFPLKAADLGHSGGRRLVTGRRTRGSGSLLLGPGRHPPTPHGFFPKHLWVGLEAQDGGEEGRRCRRGGGVEGRR